MNTTNKQDVVRTQLAKEFIVQNLRGEKRLLPIKDYAERFKVGLGTVQSALNDLKASGAVTLNACGAQGTFLGDVDQKALWNMSGYGILVALLPLDTDPGIKGLATGLYEAFTHYDLPIHILFARGSANRTDILLRGKCDFAVMSELAYHHAQAIGKPVLKVGEIGRRACPYGVLLPRNGTHSTPLRMAYDSYSYEQEALIRLVGAVCCEASEDWSSRRYMEPSAIEGLWEREAAPAPEPTGEQVSRARARIVALSGLDEGAMAA